MREHTEHEENVDRLFQPTPNDGPPLLWLKSHARYVRARLDGRALVTAWLPGNRALAVEYVFALRDESVVLQGKLEDGTELHVSARPDNIMLEMRAAPKGADCTIFAFMGVSRTPQPVINCVTGEDHDHEEGGHHL
jgi:hypothetical protein